MNQLVTGNLEAKMLIKKAVFPNEIWHKNSNSSMKDNSSGDEDNNATRPAAAVTANSCNNLTTAGNKVPVMPASIDPVDAPYNTLRGQLVKLMISLDTQVKRCISELLFTLCNEDGKCTIT